MKVLVRAAAGGIVAVVLTWLFLIAFAPTMSVDRATNILFLAALLGGALAVSWNHARRALRRGRG